MEAEKQIKEESVDQPEKKEEDKRFVMVGEPVEKKGISSNVRNNR